MGINFFCFTILVISFTQFSASTDNLLDISIYRYLQIHSSPITLHIQKYNFKVYLLLFSFLYHEGEEK